MMSTLLKLGLSGYDVKPRFGAFQRNVSYEIPLFLEKNFDGTRHSCEKMNPPSMILGGGVHGKVCWFIAYYMGTIWYIFIMLHCLLFVDCCTF